MLVLVFASCFICVSLAASGKLVSNDASMYPRVVVLQYNGANNGRILLDVTGWNPAGVGQIYESTNNGTSFSKVGAIADSNAASGICCTTLFELPVQIGSMPAGTLLWAGSLGQSGGSNRRMTIRMWQSRDVGKTWSFVSAPAVAANTGGLWEPEFSIDANNQLVCHFSDETDQPKYSQLLQAVTSKDGITWSQRNPTVASSVSGNRPGMANVRKLSSNLWVMTYEVCGVGGKYDCAAHFRTSTNGQNWGDATNMGTIMEDSAKRFFAHAPTIAFSPERNILILTGQMLYQDGNGSVDAGNGKTMFVTDSKLAVWTAQTAPVNVPDAKNDPCPNYSSGLAFINKGSELIEVATDYDGSTCKAYYNLQNV